MGEKYQFEMEYRNRKEENGLIICEEGYAILVENPNQAAGEASWVDSGWRWHDVSQKYDDPASTWTLVHTRVIRADGSVAFEGAGLSGMPAAQEFLAEEGL